MKINVCFAIYAIMICVLLCSCTQTMVDPESDDHETQVIEGEDASVPETSYYIDDQMHFQSENYVAFYLLIQDNPIDTEYSSTYDSSTTKAMVDHEMKYVDIWWDELKYSCEEFLSILNEEDQIRFESIQENWENNIKDEMTFSNLIFNGDNYSVHMGSDFQVEQASAYRKAIRERTLLVKYFQYCMEANDENIDQPAVIDFCYLTNNASNAMPS